MQSWRPFWYQVSKPIQFSSGIFTFVLHQIKKLIRFKPRRFHQKDLIFSERVYIECNAQQNFPWSIKWSRVPLNFVATWLNRIVSEMSIQLKRDAGEEGSDMKECFWNWRWSLKSEREAKTGFCWFDLKEKIAKVKIQIY